MLSSRVLLSMAAALPAHVEGVGCELPILVLLTHESHPGAQHTAARESFQAYFGKLTMLPQRNKKSRLLRFHFKWTPRRLILRRVSPSFPTVVAGLVERWPTARTCASRSASAAWMIISSRDFPISPGRAVTA